MARYTYFYVNHTYLQNLSAPSCYLTTAVVTDCYSEVTAYTVLAYSVFMTRMDAKVIPTDITNYSYHIKPTMKKFTHEIQYTYKPSSHKNLTRKI